MTPALSGALLGLLAATGLLLAVQRSPLVRRVRLDDRLAPYLRDTAAPSRLLQPAPTVAPFPTLARLARPAVHGTARRLERLLGGSTAVRRRLDRLGRGQTVESFRTEQVLAGFAGLLLGLVILLASVTAQSGLSPVAGLVLVAVLTLGGVYGRDWWLTQQVRAREQRMLEEFPTIAELIALAVAAGEGPAGALARVAALGSGELPAEIGRTLAEARAGAPLVPALQALANRTALDPLARFVDGLVVAIERGTPLAEVLRAQAVDVREAGKRQLLEAAGRKEIAMMLPVVFLVLPVTVLFALFPAVVNLTAIAR